MNQPAKLPRKSGATSSASKSKKKTRAELDVEGRDRKRANKRRGLKAGSRANPNLKGGSQQNTKPDLDPRIGSKKPVSLIIEGNQSAPVAPKVKKVPQPPVAVKLSPEDELDRLENDERLDGLLDKLEQGKTLSAEEQTYVDTTLDRIDELMEQLGISLGDDDEDDEQQEDMMQLLKRGSPDTWTK
jgi:ribosome assembly protein YihI (activator of Der GTPase)